MNVKNNLISHIRKPSNWFIIVGTYLIWLMLGMRYSSNNNFDLVVMSHLYMLLTSLVSIIVGIINPKLARTYR